jgi:tetratricopeptide (TPR) repeat protein
VSVLWYFWRLRGHIEEGRRWTDRVLALPSTTGRTSLRARGLSALGGLAYWQNDFGTAIPAYEEALQIHRDLGEREATVRALFDLGTTRGVTGDGAAAWALLEESLVTAREVGDRRGEAWALWGLGSAAYFGGDAQLSRTHLEESLRLFEELGDVWGLGNVVAGLAGLALQAGEFDQARAHVLRTMDLWEGEPSPLNAAMQVNILAIVANALGKHERAARLAGAAAAFRERAGGRAPEAFTSAFPEPGAAAAEALDEETFQKAWHEGQAMALEEALAYAREEE